LVNLTTPPISGCAPPPVTRSRPRRAGRHPMCPGRKSQ